MVLKTPAIPAEVAAKMAEEGNRQFAAAAVAKQSAQDMVLRQWCIEQAVKVCGEDSGITWFGIKLDAAEPPVFKCALVPIAEQIFQFITSKD